MATPLPETEGVLPLGQNEGKEEPGEEALKEDPNTDEREGGCKASLLLLL